MNRNARSSRAIEKAMLEDKAVQIAGYLVLWCGHPKHRWARRYHERMHMGQAREIVRLCGPEFWAFVETEKERAS